jgi:hypothetical protein
MPDACNGLVHLLHSESTWIETPCHPSQCWVRLRGFCQLSQEWVRLHVDWANMEWDSMSIGSTWNSPICIKIAPFPFDSVDMWSRSMLAQSKWSPIQRRLTWWRMKLCVNWITPKRFKKNFLHVIELKNKVKNNPKALFLSLYRFCMCKKQNKNFM